jgi:hypothetical protein
LTGAGRPKLALVSPAPPERSGLIDAVHELIDPLARRADLRLYLDDAALRHGGWRGRHHLMLGHDLRCEPDLLPVYQVGNHVSCLFLLPLAYRFPGLLVLHDLSLHHVLARFFLQRGLEGEYQAELGHAYGTDGVRAARIINSGFYSETLYARFPLFAGLVGRSRAVLVHSAWAAEQVAQACPGTPVFRSPLHSGWSHLGQSVPTREEARRHLGLPADAFVTGTAGNLTASRRLASCLEAFRRHLTRHPRSIYLLAGREAMDVGGLVRGLGLERSVVRLGPLSLPAFHAAIAACDVLCNLRFPSMGETSGSLIRILGVGRPALVSNYGQWLDFPEAFCPRVDVDEREASQLEAYFDLLSARPELTRPMGEAARRQVTDEHRPEAAVEVYLKAAAEASRRQPMRPPPRWCDPAAALRQAVAPLAGTLPAAEPDLEPVIAALLDSGSSGRQREDVVPTWT